MRWAIADDTLEPRLLDLLRVEGLLRLFEKVSLEDDFRGLRDGLLVDVAACGVDESFSPGMELILPENVSLDLRGLVAGLFEVAPCGLTASSGTELTLFEKVSLGLLVSLLLLVLVLLPVRGLLLLLWLWKEARLFWNVSLLLDPDLRWDGLLLPCLLELIPPLCLEDLSGDSHLVVALTPRRTPLSLSLAVEQE